MAAELDGYRGEWFEVMRLDHSCGRGLTNVTATYTLRADGSVHVLNKGLDHKNCRWKEADGRAVFQGAADIASLSVTFFWPFAGGYHVFALDHHNYQWTMILCSSRDYLWILSRQTDLDSGVRNSFVTQARELGFPVDQLIFVDHSELVCDSGRRP